MTDRELVEALDAFHREVRGRVKGAKTEATWILYGLESDYVLEGASGEGKTLEDRGWEVRLKDHRAWECYVLYGSGGVLTGHASGRPERGGRTGFTGRIDEVADRQFIHQLLPAEYAALADGCGVKGGALSFRRTLLEREPLLASCHLYFYEFLKSVYRIATSDESSILRAALEGRAGSADLDAFLASASKADQAVRGETRPCVVEVDAGKVRVYSGSDKRSRRCVNGWLWGESDFTTAEGAGEGEEAPALEEGQYEDRIKGAPFYVRAGALWEEAGRLLDMEEGAEVLDLALRAKTGRFAKALRQVDEIADGPDLDSLPVKQREALKALAARAERDARLFADHGSLLASWGVDLREVAKQAGPSILRLKRKLGRA